MRETEDVLCEYSQFLSSDRLRRGMNMRKTSSFMFNGIKVISVEVLEGAYWSNFFTAAKIVGETRRFHSLVVAMTYAFCSKEKYKNLSIYIEYQ